MSNNMLKLAGYCMPYNKLMRHGDEYYYFESGAFSAMVNGKLPPIDLRWKCHEDTAEIIAHTDDHNVGFFEDAHGLAFHADLDRRHLPKVAQITSMSPADRCSVLLVIDDERAPETHLGLSRRQITRAHIEHLACGLTTSGFDSAVWCPDVAGFPEDAPWRVQQLAETWNAGFAAYNAAKVRRAVTAATVASASPSVPGALRGPRGALGPADRARLQMLLNSRRVEHVRAQTGFCHELSSGVPQIWGHAGLGKNFGAGEIRALINSSRKVR